MYYLKVVDGLQGVDAGNAAILETKQQVLHSKGLRPFQIKRESVTTQAPRQTICHWGCYRAIYHAGRALLGHL